MIYSTSPCAAPRVVSALLLALCLLSPNANRAGEPVASDPPAIVTSDVYVVQLQKKVAELTTALDVVRAELVEARKTNGANDARVRELEARNASLEKEIATLRSEIARDRVPAILGEECIVVFQLAADPGAEPAKVAIHWDGMLAASALVVAGKSQSTRVESLLPRGVGALAMRYKPVEQGRKLYVLAVSINGAPIEIGTLRYSTVDGSQTMAGDGGITSGQIVISRSDLSQMLVSGVKPKP